MSARARYAAKAAEREREHAASPRGSGGDVASPRDGGGSVGDGGGSGSGGGTNESRAPGDRALQVARRWRQKYEQEATLRKQLEGELELERRLRAEADAKVDELRRHIILMELELQEARAKLQEYREAEAKASGPSELQMAMERTLFIVRV